MLDATLWAWKQQNIKPSDKLVLLSLADRANDKCDCWPSYDRLALDTCLNRKTIAVVIKRLVAAGLIEKSKRFSNSNVYHLIGVPERHETPSSTKNGTSAESGPTSSTTLGPTSSTTLGPTSSTKNGTLISQGTSHRTYQLLEGVSDAVWSEWVEYKKQTGKPVKHKATITKAQKLLAKYPHHVQQQIIDQSIQSGYAGLFEPKTNGAKSNGKQNVTESLKRSNADWTQGGRVIEHGSW